MIDNRYPSHLPGGLALLLIWLCLAATPIPALAGKYPNPKNHDYDAENGEEINELCAGCHGEFGQGGGDGEYPRLAGLPAKYLAKQLHQFKIQERSNVAMSMYATERELPADDLLDIAIYLSKIELLTTMPEFGPETTSLEKLQTARQVFNVARIEGDVSRGRIVFTTKCSKCHGKDGLGRGSIPPLVGQYTEYLELQIAAFQSDQRVNKRMKKSMQSLTPPDIAALLAFLSVADDQDQ